MKCKISVIVPCYNVEAYIAKCLDSLVSQDIDVSYEVVVVDDGSKDKSATIVEDYIARYPEKIRIIYKSNGGVGSARNYGISCSESDYITFVDSDDYVASNYLSSLYHSIESNSCDISMCGAKTIAPDKKRERIFNTGFCHGFVTTNKTFIAYSSYAPWCKLYKRELFSENKFPERMHFEDLALIPVLLYKASKVVYVDSPLYFYRQNPNSIIHAVKKDVDLDLMKAYLLLQSSELSASSEIMSAIFIRRMILDLSRAVIKYNSEICTLESIYKMINEYNLDVINNEYYKHMSLYRRFYTYFFVHKKFGVCVIMEKVNLFARKIAKL